MSPTFAPPDRHSLLMPIVLALAAIGASLYVIHRLHPASAVTMQYVHTAILPTHTVFTSDSIVLGPRESVDVLFVTSALHIENHMSFPASLENYTLLLKSADGSEQTVKAVQTSDVANLELTFPALKPLLTKPLPSETTLPPGQAVDGVVLFSIPTTQATWTARQAAILKVDVYHQPSLLQTVPKP